MSALFSGPALLCRDGRRPTLSRQHPGRRVRAGAVDGGNELDRGAEEVAQTVSLRWHSSRDADKDRKLTVCATLT